MIPAVTVENQTVYCLFSTITINYTQYQFFGEWNHARSVITLFLWFSLCCSNLFHCEVQEGSHKKRWVDKYSFLSSYRYYDNVPSQFRSFCHWNSDCHIFFSFSRLCFFMRCHFPQGSVLNEKVYINCHKANKNGKHN